MIITRFNDVRILRVITGRVITIKQGDYKIILAQWREITHSYVITKISSHTIFNQHIKQHIVYITIFEKHALPKCLDDLNINNKIGSMIYTFINCAQIMKFGNKFLIQRISWDGATRCYNI